MSKGGIIVLTVIGYLLAFAGFIVSSVTSQLMWETGLAGLGVLICFVAWLLALREAWWSHAWVWLIVVFITSVWLGPLLWGLFGPGMIAPLAKQKLRAIRDSRLAPSAVGINAPAWTPQLAKVYLQREGFETDDLSLLRALRQLHWLV